jgi:hypothetical protein
LRTIEIKRLITGGKRENCVLIVGGGESNDVAGPVEPEEADLPDVIRIDWHTDLSRSEIDEVTPIIEEEDVA